jgi:serine/threonine protein kinase
MLKSSSRPFLQENVLLDDNLRVQIVDFGLTRLSAATNTRSGTLHLNFAAPELFAIPEDNAFDDIPFRTTMSDVYAFGCLYYQVSFNKHIDKALAYRNYQDSL